LNTHNSKLYKIFKTISAHPKSADLVLQVLKKLHFLSLNPC
jgi:hypothetical protein